MSSVEWLRQASDRWGVTFELGTPLRDKQVVRISDGPQRSFTVWFTPLTVGGEPVPSMADINPGLFDASVDLDRIADAEQFLVACIQREVDVDLKLLIAYALSGRASQHGLDLIDEGHPVDWVLAYGHSQ